eukprot:361347_1
MMAPACWLQIVYCVITVIIALVSSQNYVLYEEELVDWEDGNAFCAFSYGTSLASIHDATEDSEAGSKCTSSDCWIGATTLDSVDWSSYDGIWKWRDETIFDYGNDILCGIPPRKDGNPSTVDSNGNPEWCGEIDQITKEWNDNQCTKQRHILCNSPSNSSSIVIDDNINNIRHPISNHSFGKMDILDDVHVEFDFKVLSFSNQTETNILHVGVDLDHGLPSIRAQISASGVLTLSSSYYTIEKANQRLEFNTMSTIVSDSWYHLSFDLTQSTAVLSLDDSTIVTRYQESSHPFLPNQDIYILSHPLYTSMDGLVRNVKITTDNAYAT